MSADDSLWFVKLADGDVERVTLDQLDEAFQNGQIDENSMVLAAGSDQWIKLADLLQLSEATPPPPPPTPSPQPAMQPVPAPAVQLQPVQPAATMHPQARPPQPLAAMPVPASQFVTPVASTMRPISVDLSVDDWGAQYPRRSRKGLVVGVMGTALVLGGAAFFAVTRTAATASTDTAGPSFAAAAAAAPLPVTPPEPIAPTPPAQAQASNAGGPSSVMDPTRMDSSQHLTDAQKQKLLDTDKDKRAKVHEHAHSAGGGAMSHAPPKSKSLTTFTTGGNKFDPLNSTL